MKSSLLVVAAALVFLDVLGCGGRPNKASGMASAGTSTNLAKISKTPHITFAPDTPAQLRRLRQDEDDDDEGMKPKGEEPAHDADADTDNDQKDHEPGYDDGDDSAIITYGQAAKGAERGAIESVVRRYFTAAANGDGVAACSVMDPKFALLVPEDYGQSPGPSYMRGKTCAVVASRFFAHARRQMEGTTVIAGVRISGNRSLALIGAANRPASYMLVERKHGVWGIVGLTGSQLP